MVNVETFGLDPEALKNLGNNLLRKLNFDGALTHYTKAIEAAKARELPVHTYYANRVAVHLNRENYEQALEDSEHCILEAKLANVTFPKAYLRKGQTLHHLKRYTDAAEALQAGLQLDPENTLIQKELTNLQPYLETEDVEEDRFVDIEKKLEQNPETKKYLTDVEFLTALKCLKKNPQTAMNYLKNPKIMKALAVATGIHMDGGEGHSHDQTEQIVEVTTVEEQADAEEQLAIVESKLKSSQEKELGTAAYKAREFETAHKHYSNAFDLDPANALLLNNRAAVSLEEKKYGEAREFCYQALDVVQREANGTAAEKRKENNSKIMSRVGVSYQKEKNLVMAMEWYSKSLDEFANKSIETKLKTLMRKVKSSELCEDKFSESKKLADAAFEEERYQDAVTHYLDCTKRKDDNKKSNSAALSYIYTQLAVANHKLLKYNAVVNHANVAIRLEEYVSEKTYKPHLIKAAALEATNDWTNAERSYLQALKLKTTSLEAQEGITRCTTRSYAEMNTPEKVRERVLQDPDVREIMMDPAMRIILEQMEKDPELLKNHLQEPRISRNIQKLVDVGIITLVH